MKIVLGKNKTKIPNKYQIKKMFATIKDFQKNNIKYLLLSEKQIENKTASPNIFTTINTNI